MPPAVLVRASPKDESKAMQLLKLGCDGGDKHACQQLTGQ
jgi:TPR repeat protein